MREDIVGLHITDDWITAVETEMGRRGDLRLRHAGWVRSKPDLSERELSVALRSLWRRFSLSSRTVATTFRNSSCQVKYFIYPYLNSDELRMALNLEAEESLLLPPDQISLDWHINESWAPQSGTEGGGKVEGVLVAAPRRIIDADLRAFRKARLSPVVMNVDLLAIANLYLAVESVPDDTTGTGLVVITPPQIGLCVLFGGTSVYARTVKDTGGCIETLLDILAEDLRYCSYKLDKPPVGKFAVTGTAANLVDIAEAVAETVGAPASPWDPLASVNNRCRRLHKWLAQVPEAGQHFTVAMGLSMQN